MRFFTFDRVNWTKTWFFECKLSSKSEMLDKFVIQQQTRGKVFWLNLTRCFFQLKNWHTLKSLFHHLTFAQNQKIFIFWQQFRRWKATQKMSTDSPRVGSCDTMHPIFVATL